MYSDTNKNLSIHDSCVGFSERIPNTFEINLENIEVIFEILSLYRVEDHRV